jgi:hypothetical protein
MKMVNYTPDQNNLLQLTKAEESRLASLSVEQIDYSDIKKTICTLLNVQKSAQLIKVKRLNKRFPTYK